MGTSYYIWSDYLPLHRAFRPFSLISVDLPPIVPAPFGVYTADKCITITYFKYGTCVVYTDDGDHIRGWRHNLRHQKHKHCKRQQIGDHQRYPLARLRGKVERK